jgi:hypothetical protein
MAFKEALLISIGFIVLFIDSNIDATVNSNNKS